MAEQLGVPLSRVLHEVGSTLLDVAAGADTDPLVTGVAIHDPTDPAPHRRGALVLGVGVVEVEPACALLAELARAGAAGLVLRAQLPLAPLRDVVDRTGVPVLVATAAPWTQLLLLLRAVVVDGPAEPPIGDLFTLSNTVAAALGGAVTIEDRASRVLAFSANQAAADAPRVATVLGREVPAEWRDRLAEAGVFDRLYSSAEPIDVVLPVPGLRPRVAIAVRAGEEILGSIWATTDGPLDAERCRTLTSAARTAALHVLQQRAVETAGRRRRAELTARMLDGGAGAAAAAGALGLPAAPLAVVAARADGAPHPAAERAAQLERTCDALGLHLAAASPAVVTTILDSTAYAVLPLAPGLPRGMEQVRQTLGLLAARREPPIVIGIGRQVAGPEHLDASRAEADAVVGVLPHADRRVAALADVWAQVVLAHVPVPDPLRGFLGAGPVPVLARYDAAHGTPLLLSLRRYLDAFGDMVAAARALHVHPNTLRYRLRRIAELTVVDLDDPDVRLAVALQLRLDGADPTRSPHVEE